MMDFEIFRPALDVALQRSDGSKGGHPPMDAVMMFKALIVQTLYGRLGRADGVPRPGPPQLQTFPGCRRWRNTPDETAIWRLREALVRAGAIDALLAV